MTFIYRIKLSKKHAIDFLVSYDPYGGEAPSEDSPGEDTVAENIRIYYEEDDVTDTIDTDIRERIVEAAGEHAAELVPERDEP